MRRTSRASCTTASSAARATARAPRSGSPSRRSRTGASTSVRRASSACTACFRAERPPREFARGPPKGNDCSLGSEGRDTMSETIRKLSVVDSAFLFGETPECPMHVGSLTIVKLPDGYDGDFYEDFKARCASQIHRAPSLRWKLASTPFDIDRPSWIEDEQFDLSRHILRGALPAPRDRVTAERIAGWLHAKTLNRARPLWEIYVFDGMPNNEAAIYSKMHHALIDGGAGAALTEILYETSAEPPSGEAPPRPKSSRSAPKGQDPRDVASSMFAAYAELWRTPFQQSSLKSLELPRSGGSDLASVLLDATIHSVEWPLRLGANLGEIATAYSAALSNAFKPASLKALDLLSAPSTP